MTASARRSSYVVVGLMMLFAAPADGHGRPLGLDCAAPATAQVDRLVRLSERATAIGSWDEAAEYLDRAIRLDPECGELRIALGDALERSGRWAEAILAYRSALEVAPDAVVAAERLAALLAAHDDLEGAIWLLERMLSRHPDVGSLHYHLALLVFREEQGPSEAAVRGLERARELGFDRPHLYLLLGRAARARAGPAAAMKLLDTGLARAPDDPQLLREKGRALAEMQDFDGSATLLERAREELASDRELVAELARVYLQGGRAGEALRLVDRPEWQDDPNLLYIAARARRALGDPAAAETVERYRTVAARARAAETAVADALAEVRSGILAWGVGDLAAAADHFRAADRARPGWPTARAYLATALLAAGRSQEALGTAREVLTEDPGNSQALIVIGKATLADRPGEAIAALEQAVDLYPFRVACLLALAEAYLQLGRDADARPLLLRAQEVEPDDPWIRKLLDGHVDPE